eukprot:Awhi_evm1s14168
MTGQPYQHQLQVKVFSVDTYNFIKEEWERFENDDGKFLGGDYDHWDFNDQGLDPDMDYCDDGKMIISMVYCCNLNRFELYDHFQAMDGVEAVYLEWKCWQYCDIGWLFKDYSFWYPFPKSHRDSHRQDRLYGEPLICVAGNLALSEDCQDVWSDDDYDYSDNDLPKREPDDWRGIAIWKRKVQVFGN